MPDCPSARYGFKSLDLRVKEDMAELADALDSKFSWFYISKGSSPFIPTFKCQGWLSGLKRWTVNPFTQVIVGSNPTPSI